MCGPPVDVTVELVIFVNTKFLGVVDRARRTFLIAVGSVDEGIDGREEIVGVVLGSVGGVGRRGFEERCGFGEEGSYRHLACCCVWNLKGREGGLSYLMEIFAYII